MAASSSEGEDFRMAQTRRPEHFFIHSMMRLRSSVLLLLAPAISAQDSVVREVGALRFSGDLRFRQEGTFDVEDISDRYRARMRLRLAATYAIEDQLEVGGRVTSGDPDDPRSPHVTLGDGFDSFDISVDRAFGRWTPSDRIGVTFGKFGNPMRMNPVYGELVWDADVQPEGIAMSTEVGDIGLTFGQYSLQEFATRDDSWITFLEARASTQLTDGVQGHLSAAYTSVSQPDGTLEDNRGNAESGDAYASDFGVLDVIADVRFDD